MPWRGKPPTRICGFLCGMRGKHRCHRAGPSRNKDDLRRILPPRFVRNMVSSFVIELDEIEVLGDVAFARGRYTCDYTEEYAQPRTDGKFLSILKRQTDGKWKFHIDCFNSNIDPTYTS